MAQVVEVALKGLPPALVAQIQSYGELDEQEFEELQLYIVATTSSAKTNEDWRSAVENALFLFFEQRRRTRTYVIGCSVLAASLGMLMGYFVGKPAKGKV